MEKLEQQWTVVFTYVYGFICTFDLFLGPVLFNSIQYLNHNQLITAYQSVTLSNGGMFHMVAMAIIGSSYLER